MPDYRSMSYTSLTCGMVYVAVAAVQFACLELACMQMPTARYQIAGNMYAVLATPITALAVLRYIPQNDFPNHMVVLHFCRRKCICGHLV